MKKNIHIYVFLFICSWWLFTGCTAENTKTVAYGDFEATETTVSAQTQGQILSFNVEEGDTLKQGQVIGFVDTTDLTLKWMQLIASKSSIYSRSENVKTQIQVFEAQKKTDLINQDRIAKMLKDSAATQRDMDNINGAVDVVNKQIVNAGSQYATILADLASMDKQIAQVRDQIKNAIIVSPLNGTVLVKYAELGEVAVPGRALFKMADMSIITLRVYISEPQLTQFKIGQKVKVLVDGPDAKALATTGIVSWISSEAEFTPKIIQTKEERVNLVYAIKVLVDNKNGMYKIAMPAEIELLN